MVDIKSYMKTWTIARKHGIAFNKCCPPATTPVAAAAASIVFFCGKELTPPDKVHNKYIKARGWRRAFHSSTDATVGK